tara:strand:- start:235 stop:654 length:420 start_codon:yes stop_codon:yes gene_type:complete
MKLQAVLLSTLFLTSPAFAGGPRVGHRQTHFEEYCYKNVEKYIPGYYNEFGQYVGGYVKNRRERVRCGRHYVPQTSPRYEEEYPNTGNVDNNSCIEGSILGGIAGGGIGAAASRGDGRWWAIPLGIVGGSMVGCQIDGG